MADEKKRDLKIEFQLRDAIIILGQLIMDHGAKSEPVRDFIHATAQRKGMGEFKSLAFTYLLLAGWKKNAPTAPHRNRRAPPRG
jgi:uncharacterized membrane protein YjjP (DUF1212 family)